MSENYCVSCVIQTDDRDLAMPVWFALGMQGSEEETVENGIRIKVYFADLPTAEQARIDLEQRAPLSPVLVSKVENQDWNARWRESMKPAKLANHFWVSPTWLPPTGKEGDKWIKIEPKMAFGTGHHETTRLASKAIISKKKWLKGKRVLDIGTGSGVLCFVADICGARCSLGVEIDPDCLENLNENLLQNAPSGVIDFLIGSLDSIKPLVSFDLIVMNMLITESTPLLTQVGNMLEPGGLLIWSGILTEERDTAIERAGLLSNCKLQKENTEHEWWSGIFIKEPVEKMA